jgi:hypothetical protein
MPGAFQVHERDAVDRRDALHQRDRARALVDQRARLVGAKVFLIQIGMRFWTAGAMVCGWMTLAPKYASSIASL